MLRVIRTKALAGQRLAWLVLGGFATTLAYAAPQDPSALQPAPEGQSAPTAPNPTDPAARPALEFRFEGTRAIETEELRSAVEPERGAWERGLAGEFIANDCAYEVEQLYLRRGYAAVRVQAQFVAKAATVVITVQEGPQSRIVAWEWPGAIDAEGLRPSDLAALYRGSSPPPLVQRELRALPGRVRERYRSSGYLDVRVDSPEVQTEQGQDHRVRVTITPGPRYRLGAITHDLPEELAATTRFDAALAKVSGSAGEEPVYDPTWVPLWSRAASKALGQAGYLDARIDVQTRRENQRVQVHIAVQLGEQVRLGEIIVPEDLGVRRSFLLRQMDLQSGSLLTPEDLDQALVRLYRTGRFEQVRLQTRGDGPVRDLVMTAEEQPEREAFLEPGYGSFERSRLRVGWRHYNVGGVARSLRVEGVLAERADRLLIGWNDPWTLPKDWILDVNLDTQLRKLPAYDRRTSSAGVFASRSFGQHLRWTTDVGVRHSRVRVQDVRIDILSDPDLAKDLTSTTLEWGLRYDSRNHPLVPRSGQFASLTLQQSVIATGSASPFSKVQLGWARFFSWSASRTLALGFRTAVVIPESKDELPLGLRLFSGGENSVRSFRESELGPKDANGTPLGGEASTTLSLEFLQDIGATRWQAALFADVGNVLSSASDWSEFSDMESALGIGVRYLLPIGPLRVDWGYNPDPGPDDPRSVLHFSVGMAF